MFYGLSIVYILIDVCSSEHVHSWNYINLHCRDNENKPVDWWYLYKPPLDAAPKLDLGRNFSYIVPGAAGRWKVTDRYIDSNSMLQHTLSPLYRPTYSHNLAVIAYSDKNDTSKGSSAHGLMMADELGGVWLGHTVPDLIDFKMDRPLFPKSELDKGHLIMCLSLDLPTLNLVAASIKDVSPTVLHMKVPQKIRRFLPNWQHFNRRINNSLSLKAIAFVTIDGSLRATMIVRRPGDKRCLYKTFARAKRVILDVYGHDKRTPRACNKKYGIRTIDSISLKYPETPDNVYYIDNKTDRANFAVSTAAHWQKKGKGLRQFWTCTSTVEREDSTDKGGLILCVENYDVWWSFDNMKVKEPAC